MDSDSNRSRPARANAAVFRGRAEDADNFPAFIAKQRLRDQRTATSAATSNKTHLAWHGHARPSPHSHDFLRSGTGRREVH